MNRKGFAITTIIYGLSVLGVMVIFILMGILSSTRSNVSLEATRVEEELINYSKSNIIYTSNGHFTVPKGETGWYRIEVFGKPARDTIDGEEVIARGAYATGIIEATAGETYSISFSGNVTAVSYNGDTIIAAANGFIDKQTISTPTGDVTDYTVLPGGTLLGQIGEVPGGAIDSEFKLDTSNYNYNGSLSVQGFVIHQVQYCDGVGDDCGRQSYISGYPGLEAKSKYFVDGLMIAGVSNEAKVIITNIANKDASLETIPRKNNKFDNVQTIQVNFTGTSYNNCGVGHGIQSISYTIKGVTKECTCVNDETGKNDVSCNCTVEPVDENYDIDDISIIFEQESVKVGDLEVFVYQNIKCYQVSVMKNDSYYGQNIYNSSNANTGIPWTPTGIKLSAYQPDYAASSIPAHGNYYIIPVTNEAKTLSAKASSREDSEELQVEYLNGDSRQKWSIDLVNYGNEKYDSSKKPIFRNLHNRCIYDTSLTNCYNEYRLLELSRFKALSIFYDENRIKNGVSTHESFNSLSRNDPQLWNIMSVGDGTYAIRTTVTSFDPARRTGFLLANTTPGSDRLDSVYIGYGSNYTSLNCNGCDNNLSYTNVERFYLYSLDFSS